MMHTMDCDAFQDRLMAYLEDETDAATRAAMERHAGACADCGAVLADLRKLRSDAADLPELAPSRDLWAGIAERIAAPVVPIQPGRPRHARSPMTRRAWRVGVMAASLAGAAALGYLAGRRPEAAAPAPGGGNPVAQAPVAVTADPVEPAPQEMAVGAAPAGRLPAAAVPAARVAVVTAQGDYGAQGVIARLSADYDREVARLGALLERRRNQLDPATVAVIEKNLQVIDAAIAEARQAIARDPASQFLIESLNQSLQTKVELMRTAAMLPSRT